MVAAGLNGTEWFDARTTGAPPALRERAHDFFAKAAGNTLVERLAEAGQRALATAATARSREGALDLLAADALITLALLAAAEHDPASLEASARALRELAT